MQAPHDWSGIRGQIRGQNTLRSRLHDWNSSRDCPDVSVYYQSTDNSSHRRLWHTDSHDPGHGIVSHLFSLFFLNLRNVAFFPREIFSTRLQLDFLDGALWSLWVTKSMFFWKPDRQFDECYCQDWLLPVFTSTNLSEFICKAPLHTMFPSHLCLRPLMQIFPNQYNYELIIKNTTIIKNINRE